MICFYNKDYILSHYVMEECDQTLDKVEQVLLYICVTFTYRLFSCKDSSPIQNVSMLFNNIPYATGI